MKINIKAALYTHYITGIGIVDFVSRSCMRGGERQQMPQSLHASYARPSVRLYIITTRNGVLFYCFVSVVTGQRPIGFASDARQDTGKTTRTSGRGDGRQETNAHNIVVAIDAGALFARCACPVLTASQMTSRMSEFVIKCLIRRSCSLPPVPMKSSADQLVCPIDLV